jgi:hypothetical protein
VQWDTKHTHTHTHTQTHCLLKKKIQLYKVSTLHCWKQHKKWNCIWKRK